ncbi:MAG TPA: EAL domain-containing protein [Clostridia bacterium]|nr:EAL domain-containing protein [Clostridia bacterium]
MLALMSAVSDAGTATVFRRTATLFWSTVYCLLLHFCLILVKKDGFLSNPLLLFLFYFPAVICIYLYYFLAPVTEKDMVWISCGWAYLSSGSKSFLWDNFLNVYYIPYSLASIYLLYRWGRKTVLRREKIQSGIIVTTFIAALTGGTLTDTILPKLGFPLLPPLANVFILIPIFGFWYSRKKYRLMKLSPENVVLDVMKAMREGMIIVNQNRIIKDINVGALEMLGYAENELKEKSIDIIFPREQAAQSDYNCCAKELVLKTADNRELPVLFSTSALLDEWGEAYGAVSIFQDLSETKSFRNKLQEAFDEMELKVRERTKELNAANKELKNEIKSRIEMEKEIRKLAFYDHLTGLPNRRLFYDYLNRKIYESQRNELPLSVMFLDLDSFKLINDSLGHARGDELIKQVAQRLSHTLRISDTIARIGGDEFLVMVQNTPNEKTSDIIAGKILEAFRNPFNLDGYEVYITASIGIAMYPVDGEDGDTLIKNADIAMYRAKEKGKNKYEICTPKMKTSLIEIMKLTNYLYRAVEKNELELYYQPQVDIASGDIVGLEALVRWNHPELGRVLSGEFIPVAEKTGLIIPIGEWVLKTACRTNKEWQNKGYMAVPVAVNLSIKQFMDTGITDKISKILAETGLEPKYLELEITEGVLMKEVDTISSTLEQLKDMGVRISIDDFGTEYSSLNYLKQLPIDRLKIAMTFIRGISVNRKDEAIINAIIALANNLEIKTIAEGVESMSQMEFLRKAKCDVIQGYYMYKPVNTDGIGELLANRL